MPSSPQIAHPQIVRLVFRRPRRWIIGSPPPSTSRLQLAFELVEKPPIGAFGNDLLRARLDEARLAHAQRVEAHRVRSVIVSPSVVRDLVQRLEDVVVARDEA